MEPDMCREGKFKVELQTGDLNTSAILCEYFWTIENYYFKN